MSYEKQIAAAHPIITGRHELYAEAVKLVGEREFKADLVNLVNWLLLKCVKQYPEK